MENGRRGMEYMMENCQDIVQIKIIIYNIKKFSTQDTKFIIIGLDTCIIYTYTSFK